jgi:hypothetical protein
MVSIRAQSAAAVSRQNSSQGENSDQDEIQSISSQNSSASENSQNLSTEGDQTSSQSLLSQNFSSITSLIRQFIRSIFDETEEIMSTISVLVKAREIASLTDSID